MKTVVGKECYETPEIGVAEMMMEGSVLSGSIPGLKPGESEDGFWGDDL